MYKIIDQVNETMRPFREMQEQTKLLKAMAEGIQSPFIQLEESVKPFVELPKIVKMITEPLERARYNTAIMPAIMRANQQRHLNIDINVNINVKRC